MEICAVAARGDVAGADHEVAEALAFLPPGDVSRKQCIERGDDPGVIEIFGVELVHARAAEGRAEIKVVAARPFADQADLGEIRPRAAVRASGHADDDVVGRQSVRCKFLIERIAREAGLLAPWSGLRRNSMACVALPTCGLALAESERYLPDLLDVLDEKLAGHGL